MAKRILMKTIDFVFKVSAVVFLIGLFITLWCAVWFEPPVFYLAAKVTFSALITAGAALLAYGLPKEVGFWEPNQ
jgi:hypothetical protein